jgi:hypothetical protein
MKNFNFGDMFNFFDEDFLNDAMNFTGQPNQQRHGIHLMHLRKKYEGINFNYRLVDEEEVDHDSVKYKSNLPYNIYGNGTGLESTHILHFWEDKKDIEYDEKEWEEIDAETNSKNTKSKNNTKKKENSDDEDLSVEEEDCFEEFIEENTTQLKSEKLSCNLCDGKKLSYDVMKKHFIKTHQKDYESSEYAKDVPWKEALKVNKQMEAKMEKEFMKQMGAMGMGMEMDSDEDDYEEYTKSNKKSKAKGNSNSDAKMMKDFEKMMMDMLINPGAGMSAGGAGKRKKKK